MKASRIQCASRKLSTAEKSRALIQSGSAEEQIIAHCIESGISHSMAAAYVNDYRRQHGLNHIGVSAVSTWCERMHASGFAKTSRISKMKQGTTRLFLALLTSVTVTWFN